MSDHVIDMYVVILPTFPLLIYFSITYTNLEYVCIIVQILFLNKNFILKENDLDYIKHIL